MSSSVIMSGVGAEMIAPKRDPEGIDREAIYCPVILGIDVSSLKRPELADATFRTV